MSKCRSCGKEILWVRFAATGNLAPIDAEPVAGGNIALRDGKAHVVAGDLFGQTHDDGGRPRYVSHFATCTDAPAHRKAKKKAGDRP